MMLLSEIGLSDKTRKFFESMNYDLHEGRGSNAEIFQQIAIGAAVVLVFIGLLHLLGIIQSHHNQPVARQPHRLFRTTLKQLGLPFVDRVLLRLVSRASGFQHPTAMLLSPEILERLGRNWASHVAVPSVRAYAWGRLSAISQKLHSRLLPPL